jgi:hypothetical protein
MKIQEIQDFGIQFKCETSSMLSNHPCLFMHHISPNQFFLNEPKPQAFKIHEIAKVE